MRFVATIGPRDKWSRRGTAQLFWEGEQSSWITQRFPFWWPPTIAHFTCAISLTAFILRLIGTWKSSFKVRTAKTTPWIFSGSIAAPDSLASCSQVPHYLGINSNFSDQIEEKHRFRDDWMVMQYGECTLFGVVGAPLPKQGRCLNGLYEQNSSSGDSLHLWCRHEVACTAGYRYGCCPSWYIWPIHCDSRFVL